MPHLIIDLSQTEKKPGTKGYYTVEDKLDAAENLGWKLISVDGGKAYMHQPSALKPRRTR